MTSSVTFETNGALSSFDARDLRRAFGCFATGVTVVTALDPENGGKPVGITVNSFTSVSLDPPLLLWCLADKSPSLRVFRSAPAFAVSILAADQAELCQRFATPAEDKFADVAWRPGFEGVPILENALATFECRNSAAVTAGDHLVLFGAIAGYAWRDADPLTYGRGRMGTLSPFPA